MRISRYIRVERHLVPIVIIVNQPCQLLVEQTVVQVFLLEALYLAIDNLEHLIRHNQIVFLPNADEALTRHYMIALFVEVYFDELKSVVPRLHHVVNVHAHALEDASQLEDR